MDIQIKENYFKFIENSIGGRMFNSLFVKKQEQEEIVDVLNDGEYSCAFFVSSVLFLF